MKAVQPKWQVLVAAMLLPCWQAMFFLLPVILLVTVSFWCVVDYQLVPACTMDNFRSLIGTTYLKGFAESIWIAFSTACLSTAISLGGAYALVSEHNKKLRNLIFLSLLIPLLSGYILNMLAWHLWLSDNGAFATILRGMGLGNERLGLLYSVTAIRIGLLSLLIPVDILIIVVSLQRIDRTLVTAAMNLGAAPWQAFWLVTMPLIRPGLIAAFATAFILSFGDTLAPSILGGNQTTTITGLLADRLRINDWPLAAAIGTVMLLICMSTLYVSFATFEVGWIKPKPSSRLPVL